MENFGLTISCANSAIELDPTYPKSYYRRAEANMVLEHFADALKDFKKVCNFPEFPLCELDSSD
jgi:hypothetical protein